GERRSLDHPRVHGQLVTPRVDPADVDDLVSREAARRRERTLDDRILRDAVEARELQADPVVQEARVEAELELLAALGLQVRISVGVGRQRRVVAITDRRLVKATRGERPGLLPCRAPGSADTELVDE